MHNDQSAYLYNADFHARLSTSPTYSLHQNVVFDDLLESSGGGYDRTKGIYTCPVTGLYSFGMHLMSIDARANVSLYVFVT